MEKNPSISDSQVAEATVRLKGHTCGRARRGRHEGGDRRAHRQPCPPGHATGTTRVSTAAGTRRARAREPVDAEITEQVGFFRRRRDAERAAAARGGDSIRTRHSATRRRAGSQPVQSHGAGRAATRLGSAQLRSTRATGTVVTATVPGSRATGSSSRRSPTGDVIVSEETGDADVSPLADAVERHVDPPYRAAPPSGRRPLGGGREADQGRGSRFRPRDKLELSSERRVRELRVDGEPSDAAMPLECRDARRSRRARATSVEAGPRSTVDLWEVRVTALLARYPWPVAPDSAASRRSFASARDAASSASRSKRPTSLARARLRGLSDDELQGKTAEFRQRLENGETLDELVFEAFAAVREARKRESDQRMFDVQLMGGIVLHEGDIAEMKTGEGKTFVASPRSTSTGSPAGRAPLTVNDYLAQRDAEWNRPVFERARDDVAAIETMMPFDRAQARLRGRHHLRHELRVRLRLPARQHGGLARRLVQRGHPSRSSTRSTRS